MTKVIFARNFQLLCNIKLKTCSQIKGPNSGFLVLGF